VVAPDLLLVGVEAEPLSQRAPAAAAEAGEGQLEADNEDALGGEPGRAFPQVVLPELRVAGPLARVVVGRVVEVVRSRGGEGRHFLLLLEKRLGVEEEEAKNASLSRACLLSLSLCSLSGSFFFLRGQEREKKRERALVLEEARAGKRKKGRVETLPALVCDWRFGRERKKEKFEKKTAIFFLHLFLVFSYLFSYLFLTPTFSQSQKTTRQKKNKRPRATGCFSLYLPLCLSFSLSS
jgi:hypothetical protein